MTNEDTIVAIATAQVEGAISIVRLSGEQAIEIADRVFRSKIKLAEVESHTISYGYIVNPDSKQKIDEVLVSVFRAPRSFTTEDVVEINCHGGVEVTIQILQLLLRQGARLAEPGEFTKRAFLNGRIDLTQAEAISDLITAESTQATELAMDTLTGKLSNQIEAFRNEAVEILATIEVNIDYPEYDDVEEMTATILVPRIQHLVTDIDTLLETANTGQVIKNGIKTVIVGKPNVGKSSLLNTLLQEQKAIVTDIAGTTRDIVEGQIRLGSLTLNMIDTAGIRETEDVVEQIGVQKSKDMIEQAELILLMLDGSKPLEQEDIELLEIVRDKKHLILVNKQDLEQRIELSAAIQNADNIFNIAAEKDQGLEQLYKAILDNMSIDLTRSNQVFLSNVRHIHLLEEAKNGLQQALESSQIGMPIDMITIDLQDAYAKLGEILGVAIKDDLLDTLFSKFCLGK